MSEGRRVKHTIEEYDARPILYYGDTILDEFDKLAIALHNIHTNKSLDEQEQAWTRIFHENSHLLMRLLQICEKSIRSGTQL